jgi:hypothetical protein
MHNRDNIIGRDYDIDRLSLRMLRHDNNHSETKGFVRIWCSYLTNLANLHSFLFKVLLTPLRCYLNYALMQLWRLLRKIHVNTYDQEMLRCRVPSGCSMTTRAG